MLKKIPVLAALCLLGFVRPEGPSPLVFDDETRAYAVPTLTQSPEGNAVLSWTEKDPQGTVHFYFATSKDQGQNFSEKREIFAAPGIGTSRLMRPKLLFKKDGTMVAVFSNRVEEAAAATAKTAAPAHEGEHAHAGHSTEKPAAAAAPVPPSRPRDSQIVYASSTDEGRTWTAPQPVHADRTPMVRGFFDAIVLANGEVAVTYLRDLEGQPHSRDLRMVVSKGNTFGPEKVLEPFVCDCCNISLLVDAAGALHVYYRENKDNTRDIDHLTSTDNGATFSKPELLYADQWKLNGCPHSGPTSSQFGKSNLIAWYSGTTVNSPGIRVVTQEGKRLFVLDDPSAKNAWLLPAPKSTSVLLWEQNSGKSPETPVTAIAYRSIAPNTVSETRWIQDSDNATNATGLVVGDRVLVAYEVKRPSKLNAIKLSTVRLF
ncbi:MAG: exo-alpha-sialidase [Sphingobacteriaceae bacterium]|nr:exo-alpha-sialidase [Cytophagaceae bacterium]